MTILRTTPRNAITPLLPAGWSVAEAHAALTALEAAAEPPATRPLFAEPVASVDGTISWRAPPGAAVFRFSDLDPQSQDNLKAHIGQRAGSLRRAVEAATRRGDPQAARLAELLPAALEVPGFDAVFVVGGQPMLTAWGHVDGAHGRPLRLLAPFDDGAPLPPEAGWPRAALIAAAVVVVLLFLGGLAVAAFAPLGWLQVAVGEPVCRVADASRALALESAEQRERGRRLEEELARLRTLVADRRAACPIPVVVREVEAPPEPEPTRIPPPPPPKPAHADLPQEKWDKKDIAMLEGCWTRVSNMRVVNRNSGRSRSVRTWHMCFDRAGKASHKLVYSDGSTCEGKLTAAFDDDVLELTDVTNTQCSDGTFVYRSVNRCMRTSDWEADCVAHEPETGTRNIYAKFRR